MSFLWLDTFKLELLTSGFIHNNFNKLFHSQLNVLIIAFIFKSIPKPPNTMNELTEYMQLLGVSLTNIEKFNEELEDMDHDLDSIKEDISDREQSMLLDFFRDKLNDEKIFDIVKSIMDDIVPPKTTDDIDDIIKEIMTNYNQQDLGITVVPLPYPDTPLRFGSFHRSQPSESDDDGDNEVIKFTLKDENNYKEPDIWTLPPNLKITPCPWSEWQVNVTENNMDGLVILDPKLIIIPDEVITNSDYLENIDGITYVLLYNNAKIDPPRLPYRYIEFWKEYLEEEYPNYKQIADDILYNEGPTYDYLMEHPPYDRILPVLDKIVNVLKYPILDSDKNMTSSRNSDD